MNVRYLNEARELESRWKIKWNFWLERRRLKTLYESRFTRGQTAVMLEGQRLVNEKCIEIKSRDDELLKLSTNYAKWLSTRYSGHEERSHLFNREFPLSREEVNDLYALFGELYDKENDEESLD